MKTDSKTIFSNIEFEKITDHPNILIAARFWDDERYRAAKTCYKFMRAIDDMIDDRKAKEEVITCLERQLLTEKVENWINCLHGPVGDDPFLMELSQTIERFKIPLQLFHNFARSMQFDIDHNGFSTYAEFLQYSEGASVAPASVFVHLCCLNEAHGKYAVAPFDVIEVARPCAIFSYIVHIIRDFQKDQLNNLNYFALDILAKHGLTPEDLRDIAHGVKPVNAAFRAMIGEYMEYACLWGAKTLLEIQKLEDAVKGRYMLSLQIIYRLYLMVYERIDVENSGFTTAELNPTAAELRQAVAEVIEMAESYSV